MAAATDDNAGIFVKAEASGTGRSGPRFPQGLKVIAVDDDPVCLKVIESMLQKCDYHGEAPRSPVASVCSPGEGWQH